MRPRHFTSMYRAIPSSSRSWYFGSLSDKVVTMICRSRVPSFEEGVINDNEMHEIKLIPGTTDGCVPQPACHSNHLHCTSNDSIDIVTCDYHERSGSGRADLTIDVTVRAANAQNCGIKRSMEAELVWMIGKSKCRCWYLTSSSTTLGDSEPPSLRVTARAQGNPGGKDLAIGASTFSHVRQGTLPPKIQCDSPVHVSIGQPKIDQQPAVGVRQLLTVLSQDVRGVMNQNASRSL